MAELNFTAPQDGSNGCDDGREGNGTCPALSCASFPDLRRKTIELPVTSSVLVASLLLVVRPGAPSSFLLLVMLPLLLVAMHLLLLHIVQRELDTKLGNRRHLQSGL